MDKAISSWSDSMKEVFNLMMKSPDTFNRTIWDIMKNIHMSLSIVSGALVILFFMYTLLKKGIDLRNIKNPEQIISPFIRFVIIYWATMISMDLMVDLFGIIQDILILITQKYGLGNLPKGMPKALYNQLEENGMWSFSVDNILNGLIGFLMQVFIYIASITLLAIAYTRYIKLYLYTAVSGIFVSTLAGEESRSIGISYIKSYLGVCFQGVIIILALIIYSALLQNTNSTKALALAKDGDSIGAIFEYGKYMFLGIFVTLGICKGADNISQRMGL